MSRDIKPVWDTVCVEGETKIVSSTSVFLPDAKWRIRKEMIREKIHVLQNTAVNDEQLSKLDRLIRTTCQVSSVSAPIIANAKRDAVAAIESAPVKFRLALMARIMATLDIPDPVDPFSARKRIFPTAHSRPERDRIFVYDHTGATWTWNCGWYRVGSDGQKLDKHKPPLGHMKFRRAIKLATPELLGLTSFKRSRPYGMWRRGFGRVSHGLYGNGELELTDGLHAIVVFDGGIRREVVLGNLSPIGTPIARRASDPHNGKPTSEPKLSKADKQIAKMNEMLKGIL